MSALVFDVSGLSVSDFHRVFFYSLFESKVVSREGDKVFLTME